MASSDPEKYADAIEAYLKAPQRWQLESKKLRTESRNYSYETHAERVDALFSIVSKAS